MNTVNAESLIQLLALRPLTIEGGYFSETYRSAAQFNFPLYRGPRSLATAIYYLLTPDTFSRMHRVPGEEIFHFYLGDPVEMLQLTSADHADVIVMGQDVSAGMKLQHVVPGKVWQGTRLRPGGRFALMGTTMSPGFDYADYETPNTVDLVRQWPEFRDMILSLSPA